MRRTCLLRDRPTEIYTPLPPRRSLNHKDITACPLSDLTPSKSDDRNILKETVLLTLHSVVPYFHGCGCNYVSFIFFRVR